MSLSAQACEPVIPAVSTLRTVCPTRTRVRQTGPAQTIKHLQEVVRTSRHGSSVLIFFWAEEHEVTSRAHCCEDEQRGSNDHEHSARLYTPLQTMICEYLPPWHGACTEPPVQGAARLRIATFVPLRRRGFNANVCKRLENSTNKS